MKTLDCVNPKPKYFLGDFNRWCEWQIVKMVTTFGLGTKIEIKQPESSVFYLSEDNEFICAHVNVEVEPPCCSTVGSSGYIECGCGGDYGIYCPDCKNENLTPLDIENILYAEIEHEERRRYR